MFESIRLFIIHTLENQNRGKSDAPYGDFLKICVCVVVWLQQQRTHRSGQGNVFTKAKEPTK